MLFKSEEQKINLGLLLIRIGLSAVLFIHSLPKIFYSSTWAKIGQNLQFLDVGYSLKYIGFIILFIEIIAGVSLITGYLFRIFCAIMSIFYGLFFFQNMNLIYSHSARLTLIVVIIYIAFVLIGPGNYVISLKIKEK